MQIVSKADNLYGKSNPLFGKNKESIINLPSAELIQEVVKVKGL